MDLLNKLGLANPKPTQIFIKKPLIVPDDNVLPFDHKRSLTEIFSSFLQGRTESENIFRARELHENLSSRLSKLRKSVNYFTETELKIFLEAIIRLEKLIHKNNSRNEVIFNSTDAQT